MRIEWIVVVSALLPAISHAQDVAQRPVRTEKIVGAPVGVGLYEVGADGGVFIDWRAVEAAAEGPANRTSTPIAKMMLAIRDGKAKPMAQ